jgi:hypothetical protein
MNLMGSMPHNMEPDSESKEAIAERLELARLALGYPTQQAFAGSIGVSPMKWNNYVAARDRIPLNVALELCKKHRLSLDWIYRADPNGLPVALARKLDEISATAVRSTTQPHRRIVTKSKTEPEQ